MKPSPNNHDDHPESSDTQETPETFNSEPETTAPPTTASAQDILMEEPDNPLPPVSLEDLPERIRLAAGHAGWTHLMPVQSRTLPYVLSQRDVMVQSRTGSGKTGAFILPLLDRINPRHAACQALVLVPTRELARQVCTDAQLLLRDSGIRTTAVYGGVAYGPQLDAFKEGTHLVVGTPGRVLDHLLKNNLNLDNLEILVFDEADHMLSMGFYPDMKKLQRFLPNHRINSFMFSATFPPHIKRLADEFLYNPGFLSLSRDHVHIAEVEHVYYNVPAMQKDRSLIRIIEMENPVSAIIFSNTKAQVHYITLILKRFGYDADELTSDLGQGAREAVMARVRQGSLRFLVATDVAARGIDIQDLSHVFLFEPPEDPESYIHRAGRTGRAGASGEVISLVAGMEEIILCQTAKRYGIDLQARTLPNDEDVQGIVSQRIIALLEAKLRGRDRVENERMGRFMGLGRTLADNEEELSLIAMLLDDFYQESLHVPPPRPPEREDRPPQRSSAPPAGRRSGGGGSPPPQGRRRPSGGRRRR